MKVWIKDRSKRNVGLWAILMLTIFLAACSGFPAPPLPDDGEGMPGQNTGQNNPLRGEMDQDGLSQDHGQAPLDLVQTPLAQDAPVMPPMDVITVDLDAGVAQETLRSPLPECGKLDGIFLPVLEATDPLEMARALKMKVKGEKIQVMIVLDSADTSFLRDFEAEVDKQSGDQVQAYVPIARLCDLANDERVLAVYPPNQAIIQQ
jgi:hypothetical protein